MALGDLLPTAWVGQGGSSSALNKMGLGQCKAMYFCSQGNSRG